MTDPQKATNTMTTPTVTINDITPSGDNIRANDLDAVEELAESIRVNGILSPLAINKDTMTIVAGHRRYAALRKLVDDGAVHVSYPIPVHFIQVPEDPERSTRQLMLVENLQRVDLNPVEEAVAFADLRDEHSLTQKQIAERIGKSASLVSSRLRLLKLSDAVLDALEADTLQLDQAEALIPVHDDSDLCIKVLEAPHNWPAHAIESAAKRILTDRKVAEICDWIADAGGVGVSNYSELQALNLAPVFDADGKMDNPTKKDITKWVTEGEVFYVRSTYDGIRMQATQTADSTNSTKSGASEAEKKIKLAMKERNAAIAELVSNTTFSAGAMKELFTMAVLQRASSTSWRRAARYLGVEAEDKDWKGAVTELVEQGSTAVSNRALAALMFALFEEQHGVHHKPTKTSPITIALAMFDIGLTADGRPRPIKTEIEVDEPKNEGDKADE